jgi:hypothetical protein
VLYGTEDSLVIVHVGRAGRVVVLAAAEAAVVGRGRRDLAGVVSLGPPTLGRGGPRPLGTTDAVRRVFVSAWFCVRSFLAWATRAFLTRNASVMTAAALSGCPAVFFFGLILFVAIRFLNHNFLSLMIMILR